MSSQNNDVLISVDHVCKVWDHKTALEDVSFDIHRGDFIAITGPNGGGKTTLLRIVLKLLKPTSGEVIYCLTPLKIGYLPQKNMIDSHFPVTVSEVISSGLMGRELPEGETREGRLREVIKLMGLTQHAHAAIGTLSGGQLQRALLGRAIISRPELLVLDEPLSYVDKRFEHYIYSLVDSLRSSTTILLVSHEMTHIASMANRHFIIDRSLTECRSAHHIVHCDCDDEP